MTRKIVGLVAVAALAGACAPEGVDVGEQTSALSATRYAMGFANAKKLKNKVNALGDTLVYLHKGAKIALVETATPDAYATVADTVVEDVRMQLIPSEKGVAMQEAKVELNATVNGFTNPPNSNVPDYYFNLQWGHDAVNATEAWNNYVYGQNVKVAVLDTGFEYYHPDLYYKVDFEKSTDFTGEGLLYGPGLHCEDHEDLPPCVDPENPDEECNAKSCDGDDDCYWEPAFGVCLADIWSHGTHTAGTVAAEYNGIGTVGVAPLTTLILVKVLGDRGEGSFGDVMMGMLHAADVGADILNMSLGGMDYRSNMKWDKTGVLMTRVANYVRQQGATIIASAGNSAIDRDHDADLLDLPADLPGVLAISATSPEWWAKDPTTNLDVFASYSNYGQSSIDFAAPGGDYDMFFQEEAPSDPSTWCTVDSTTRPCYIFDYVFSTGGRFLGQDQYGIWHWYVSWYWSVGTSMAAPHASGVAALILSEHGGSGSLTPEELRDIMVARATDLGKPGRDDYYGLGRVTSGF